MIEGVAIYAEGRADLAVLTNIIKGVLGDDVTIYPHRPELDFDETDLHEMRPEQFSTYALVIEDCKNHAKFAAVLDAVAEERLIVIHFDAAEAHRSEFALPAGPEETLRARLVQRIEEWTCPAHHPHLRYAIAVMETEAFAKSGRKPDFATQSGPMLVINGKIHPKFSETGTSAKVRNGVGVTASGEVERCTDRGGRLQGVGGRRLGTNEDARAIDGDGPPERQPAVATRQARTRQLRGLRPGGATGRTREDVRRQPPGRAAHDRVTVDGAGRTHLVATRRGDAEQPLLLGPRAAAAREHEDRAGSRDAGRLG